MIRADMKEAGIEPSQYDFHGLRHAFIDQVVKSGTDIKSAMSLSRHNNPELTLNRYSHSRLPELAAVVDRLSTPSHTLPTSGVSSGPNGTTWNHQEPRPQQPQVDPSRHDYQGG
jgi:hypothetical protein